MPLFDIFLTALATALWGGNFVAAKFGLAHFPPFFLTSLRFFFTALLIVPFVKRPNAKQLILLAQLALALGTLHFSFLFAALYQGLDIASTSIIAQLGVPFSCLLGALFFKDRLGMWRISGLAVAGLGLLIVTGAPNIKAHISGASFALAAAFFWGVANLIMKKLHGLSVFQWLGWLSLFTVPMLLIISAVFEQNQWALLQTTPWDAALSIVYTTLCSTILGYGLWFYMIQKHAVSQVAPFSLLAPIFGIGFGQIFFAETLYMQVIIGGIITLFGVGIIVIRRPEIMLEGEAI